MKVILPFNQKVRAYLNNTLDSVSKYLVKKKNADKKEFEDKLKRKPKKGRFHWHPLNQNQMLSVTSSDYWAIIEVVIKKSNDNIADMSERSGLI